LAAGFFRRLAPGGRHCGSDAAQHPRCPVPRPRVRLYPADDEELAFVLQVLDAATRLGPNSKTAARTGVSTVGKHMTNHVVTARMAEQVLERMPKQLTARFAAMKSESVAPVLGALTSGSFNAWYLQAVTHTARTSYRERFLRRAYGDDLLSAYGL
jgi:hypothetical protein